MGENILVIHGMRRGYQNEELQRFIYRLMKESGINFHITFLESDINHLYNMISSLVKQGVHEFNIVPLLLFSAKHYLQDIPTILQHLKNNYPYIEYQVTQPLGTHYHIVNIINERIKNALYVSPSISKIVFIAHGSERYKQPNEQLKQVINNCNVANKPINMVMLYGDYSYKKRLPEILAEGGEILVVPVFLYDGFLVYKMKSEIQYMRNNSCIEFTKSLNFHPLLELIIKDQITQLEARNHVPDTTQFS